MTLLGRFAQPRANDQAIGKLATNGEEVQSQPDPAGLEIGLARKVLDAKVRLHRKLIDELNLPAIEKASSLELRRLVAEMVSRYVLEERLPVNAGELENLIDELIDEMTGLGPIEPLLKDPTINDILINTHNDCYVERAGILERVPVFFKDEAHLLRIVNKIVAAVGRRVDESQPMVDARLADGSRVNVAVRPVAVDGPLVSIRKFARRAYSLDRLVETGSLKPQVASLLAAAVRCRLSMLVSGGTGTGKTTMLNALSQHISLKERLITIEDAAELQLQQPHVGRLETRPPSIEGKGEIRQRELLKNALRMRPDRIIVGEVRGDEALDMLQAMNTGHDGSLSTIHANTPRDSLMRLETMVAMAGLNIPTKFVRHYISSALDILVHTSRLTDGSRKLVSLQELTGMEGETINLQEIFVFEQTGLDANGLVKGRFKATGIRPRFVEKLEARGIQVPAQLFDPRKSYEV